MSDPSVFGLEVTVTDLLGGGSVVRSFRKSTVRLGRNALNDFPLNHAFVSQFHAVVDFVNGDVVVRDLGSTNGCLVQGQKVSNAVQVLPPATNTFDIVSISIRVRAVSLSLIPEPMSTRKPLAVTGLLQAPSQELAAMLASGLRPNDAEETNRLRSLHQKYRKAWAEFHSEVQAAAQRRPEAERGAFVSSLSAQYPGIGAEVEFQALAADAGAPSLTMRDPEREARIALEGLRELSSAFVQGAPPPESPDDLVKFLTRVRDVLDLFFRSFLPLRDGQRQFRQELGIAASQISSGAGTVEYAKSSQELSTAVLAPGQSGDALAHVESTFADLMIHQVAMMNGVMTGVKNLLGELSPDAIRHATEQLGSRGTMSFGFGGAGAKQWWQVYERRYGDLVEEEKQIFQLLFGKQFSTAYSQAASDSTAEGPRGTIGFGSPVKR